MGGAHVGETRDPTLDVARGLAITAIVLGHVLRGLVAAGILSAHGAEYRETDRVLYLVHLSVFVFVSGLFVRRGVERRGVGEYLRGRVALFLYLYVLWSLLQGGVMLALASVVNTPTSVDAVLSLWVPLGQLWFFPFLVVVTVVTAVVRPWGRPGHRRAWPWATGSLVVALAVSMAFWGELGVVVGPQGLGLLVLFVAGAVCGSGRVLRLLARTSPMRTTAVLVASAGLFVALQWTPAVPPTSGGAGSELGARLLGLLAACAGTVAVIALARAIVAVGPMGRLLAFVGRHSLEIFVAHILAASGARVVLVRIGVTSVPLQVLGGVLAGVVLPLVLWWITERIGLRALFTAPRVLTGAVAAPRRPASRRALHRAGGVAT